MSEILSELFQLSMRSKTRSAFSLTIWATIFICFGWIIPFWHGRWYEESRSKKQWGLFYTIDCVPGGCKTIEGVIKSENVDFGGAESPVELEGIAVLATFSWATCIIAFFNVLIFHCHVCGKKYSYHAYITSAAILQLISAVFVLLTIILASISTGYFFSETSYDSVIEFPFSLLCFVIGEILLCSSAILFILIVCKWKRYRHVYARKRYFFGDDPRSQPRGNRNKGFIEPPADYDDYRKHRYKPYDHNSFVGYFRGNDRHAYGKNKHHDGRSHNRGPYNKAYHSDYNLTDYRSTNPSSTYYHTYRDKKHPFDRELGWQQSEHLGYLPYSSMGRPAKNRSLYQNGGPISDYRGVYHIRDPWDVYNYHL